MTRTAENNEGCVKDPNSIARQLHIYFLVYMFVNGEILETRLQWLRVVTERSILYLLIFPPPAVYNQVVRLYFGKKECDVCKHSFQYHAPQLLNNVLLLWSYKEVVTLASSLKKRFLLAVHWIYPYTNKNCSSDRGSERVITTRIGSCYNGRKCVTNAWLTQNKERQNEVMAT